MSAPPPAPAGQPHSPGAAWQSAELAASFAERRRRGLFAEALELLEPGGMFVNMDYVSIEGPLTGLFDERMRENAVRAEHECGGTRSDDEVDLEDDDDRPDTVEDQLQWLREAGFAQVEVHFKWAEAAIYGGTRPHIKREPRQLADQPRRKPWNR